MLFKVVPKSESILPLLDEVEVDAEDRWSAVVEASERWGLSGKIKMQILFDNVSVKKVERKKIRVWRAE